MRQTTSWVKQTAPDILAKKRVSQNISPTEQLVNKIVNSKSFKFMESTLESSLTEKARYIHILETWLRRYIFGATA